MDSKILTDSKTELNKNLSLLEISMRCEDLFLYQEKMQAMLALLLSSDLTVYPLDKLHSYNSLLDDLLENSKKISESLILSLSKIIKASSNYAGE